MTDNINRGPKFRNHSQRAQKILQLGCVVTLAVILYAGLTPFHAPKNKARWLSTGNGVRFEKPGTVLSTKPFTDVGSERTVEIWVETERVEDSSTILAFSDPTRKANFMIAQSISDLELRIEPSTEWRAWKPKRLYIPEAFQKKKTGFWTITTGPEGTAVFRDGIPVERAPDFRISSAMAGRLVLGTAPLFTRPWAGVVRGLAVYGRALAPREVEHHFQTWSTRMRPDIAAGEDCIALYLFDEQGGAIVHDKSGSGNDLYIPPRYTVVGQAAFDPVWRAFDWSWGFWRDALANVAGFVPMGFFACGYLTIRRWKRPALITVAAGAALSLFIEVIQTQLPTRDSSMSDVITNIAGTAMGVALYRWKAVLFFGRPLQEADTARCP